MGRFARLAVGAGVIAMLVGGAGFGYALARLRSGESGAQPKAPVDKQLAYYAQYQQSAVESVEGIISGATAGCADMQECSVMIGNQLVQVSPNQQNLQATEVWGAVLVPGGLKNGQSVIVEARRYDGQLSLRDCSRCYIKLSE